MTITISVDVMGGDYGPSKIIPGIKLALVSYLSDNVKKNIRFLLFGDEQAINPYLQDDPLLSKYCTAVHKELSVSNCEKPAQTVRLGVKTSLGAAVKSVANGEAHAVVSCANTGAFMALSKIYIKTFKSISRPAIPAFIPTTKGLALMLDLGANIECSPKMLVQFALMGTIYIKAYLGVKNPTVGILNIGTEDMKGTESVQEAARLFKAHKDINYKGFIEGNKIATGEMDVIVTDGFTGNVALKTLQGTATLITHLLKDAFSNNFFSKIGYFFCKTSLSKAYKIVDKRYYNGAPFLGLRGIAIKSHGDSDAVGVANAIKIAIEMAKNKLPERIEKQLTMDT
ncbi:MAG TPA: phosphate acyltransferase PlsX [Holosporales bacterium]|nr:phosphate acyltransferase PlsX [Holosporales bacterium]